MITKTTFTNLSRKQLEYIVTNGGKSPRRCKKLRNICTDY